GPTENDARAIWRRFASHYHLFRGTPTRIWLDHTFSTIFGIDERLTAESADRYYERIAQCLAKPAFRPRALYEKFNIEVLATTESPIDPLEHHRKSANPPGIIGSSPRIAPIPSSMRRLMVSQPMSRNSAR